MSTDLPPLKNRLADAASPYLRQHADNPVAWQCWDEAALRRARIEDKPIFLSIGYAACHWCHVMERESFSSPAVAAILNSRFIPVKVDREERPDLDEVYMTAVTAMTGAGGWPLSVFLTPDGLPFYGDTYFPPVDRWGKPAFTRVLLHVAGLWKEQRHRVVEGAAELAELIRRRLRPPLIAEGTDSLETILEDAVRKLEEDFDPHHGGWGAGSKFPPSGTLQWLLRRVAYRGDANAERMLRKTLDAMATGGLRDHVGGGFHRYTVDPEWQVPHFEKMLYDNALLARVFLEAGRVLDAPRYLDVGRDTLEYLIREMRDPSGGFHASEDADSGGREGMFYLWNPDEVRAALSPEDADWFMERFAILSEGNFHSHEPFHQGWSIPRLETPLTPGESARFEKIRASLRKHRLKRPAPPRDPKIIASWNGLMLSALAEAVRALGDKAYAETATRCADLLISRHFHNQAGLRSVLGDQEGPPAVLEDFAAVAVGLLDLHEVTGETRWLRSALSLTRTMIDRFSAGGLEQGFYRTATDTRDLPMSAVPWQDGQEPGPNTLAMAALRKLGLLLQEDAWLAASEKWLLAHAGLARRFPEAVPFLLALMEESVQGPVTI
ncbi:MAG TPA: thioredoxin domain-containing protein, partial [Candidatus Hydrogenedentes bacterium]|nr:thioredoxin domain-containing protein [Candidatus Hydrogenedentota bacterium]